MERWDHLARDAVSAGGVEEGNGVGLHSALK
jgi:hypothetical protein